MSVEALISAYTKLSKADKVRFIGLVSEIEQTASPDWADDITGSITEEEWIAMEQELEGVRSGSVPTTLLQDVMARLK